MARHYARLVCAIWEDPDFLALSVGAQRTYIMLISQPDVTACGSLALTVRRWANKLRQDDRPRLVEWLAELHREQFIVMDEDHEEVLVRTFVKHDGGAGNSKRRCAIDSASIGLRSPILRSALAVEMGKLGLTPRFEVPDDISAGQYTIDTLSDSTSDTSRVVVKTVGRSTTTLKPETTTLEAAPQKRAAPTADKTPRGTRLPATFEVTDDMRSWARDKAPGLDVALSTEKFRNYWQAASGKTATKLDWPATWRNWILSDYEKMPRLRAVGQTFGRTGEARSYS